MANVSIGLVSMLVSGRARIHISLADMGFASPRAFGGLGFAIHEHNTLLKLSPAKRLEIGGAERLDSRTGEALTEVITRVLAKTEETGCKIEILKSPPQHVGLGSQTTLLLAAVAGLNNLYDIDLGREEQQFLVAAAEPRELESMLFLRAVLSGMLGGAALKLSTTPLQERQSRGQSRP